MRDFDPAYVSSGLIARITAPQHCCLLHPNTGLMQCSKAHGYSIRRRHDRAQGREALTDDQLNFQ